MTQELLLGIDIGTARCKAGLYDLNGQPISIQTVRTPAQTDSEGNTTYDPERLLATVSGITRDVGADRGREVVAIGVGSMAEAGVLISTKSGEPNTPVLSWFDQRPLRFSERLRKQEDGLHMFLRSGLHPSPKYGLPKLLWLQSQGAHLSSSVWLSVADYIVYRLTGVMVTDPTLAARTFVYDIRRHSWDPHWIRHFGLDPSLFPPVHPSGSCIGHLTKDAAERLRLSQAVGVGVAGHDHIVALAATNPGPDQALDSMGTAESIIGSLPEERFAEQAFDSGLAVVPHVIAPNKCWLGGISASGSALSWLREVGLGLPADESFESGPPTRKIFLPYLLGAGAPNPDRNARGALIGLSSGDGKPNILQAVLEGVAFETESIYRAAQQLTGTTIRRINCVGGHARSRSWIQIKADVTGKEHVVADLEEATCLGAALLAGLGGGQLETGDLHRIAAGRTSRGIAFSPDAARSSEYQRIYEQLYAPLRDSLRRFPDESGRSRKNEATRREPVRARC